MIERHITFDVLPDRTSDFERFFADDYHPAMAQSPGFVSASLLRERERPTSYQMVLRFDDADSATVWRESDAHRALQPALVALHAGMAITAYDILG